MHGTASWWDTINWGTAPEWVSGLLTSVSVLLALSILAHDRRRERRRFADGFVTWVDYTGNPKDALFGEHWMYVVVHMFNSAEVHVPSIVLRYRDANGDTGAAAPLIRDETGALSHPPRTETSVKVADLPNRRYFLEFNDARNQTWYRDVKTNRYIHRWRVKWWDHRAKRRRLREQNSPAPGTS